MSGAIALEEYELLGDPRYRSYISAIDKALKSFEYTSEWADLISALGKLNKVLLNHMKYPVIPRKITISKRLAQCMHPALPSGVHLKALETYDIIFKSIGTNRLSQELFIYSAGLFPLLGNAAMNVKPSLLTVYETHFVPLGEKLRPALNGFLIGLLPGLEEGSDYYDRTDRLLLKICEEVERSYFHGCLWKCILSNPAIRLSAVTFVTSHYKKTLSMEDQLYVIGTDIDTMVQGLCALLQDTSVLVQRSALDLLLLGFPMHNKQLVPSDVVRIVTAAVTVLLRRDMSLNRRLFSWLMGGESLNNREESVSKDEDHHAASVEVNTNSYFELYSKDLLLQALRVCFDSPVSVMSSGSAPSGSPELWCYRLLISLLDRPEISSVILDDILIDVFRSLYLECDILNYTCKSRKTDRKKVLGTDHGELIKTANLLFGTLEPWYMWAYCGKLFESACKNSAVKDVNNVIIEENCKHVERVGSGLPSIAELCTLIEFLLEVVSLETYVEARTEHLPELLCHIADALSENCAALSTLDISLTLNVCSKILSRVQPPVINITEKSCDCFVSEAFACDNSEIKSNLADSHIQVNTQAHTYEDRSYHDEHSSQKKDHSCLREGARSYGVNCSKYTVNSLLLPRDLSTTITHCVEKYQMLFVVFLKSKMIQDVDLTFERFQHLLLPKKSTATKNKEKLEDLLHRCLDAKCNCVLPENSAVYEPEESDYICSTEILFDMKEEIPDNFILNQAFQRLCHLLVELSSFPTFCTNSKKLFDEHLNKGGNPDLPEWLKLLTAIACFVHCEEIFLSAMSALFDLIALTKSVNLNHTNNSSSMPPSPANSSDCSSVVSVVIIPVLSVAQVNYLSENTSLFPLAAAKLWSYVGDTRPSLCVRGVELLQQVHNLSPISTLCEGVICHSMASGDEIDRVLSQKKFCMLWHMTRHLSLKSTPSTLTKTFDRCFFLMLDNLGKETGPEKAVSQAWLNHSLQRGDVARFLEPILLILLHPDSARVSVQHVNVYCPKKSTDGECKNHEEVESKIYAISSVSGNIMYHISDDSHPSSHQGSPEKKILALTSLIDIDGNKGSKVVTQSSKCQDFDLPSSHERDIQLPISVFVNPFGSLSSLGSDFNAEQYGSSDLPEVKHIHSFRKSSFDDDGIDSDTYLSSEETSTEKIVAEIIDDMITLAIAKSSLSESCEEGMESAFSAIEDAHLSYPNDLCIHGNDELADTKLPMLSVHPLHTHILLYCQVYDSQKALYVLYSLKAIVLTNPRVALCSMATTNVSSSLSARGQQLQVLLARHRKSVFGNNFHGELAAESTTTFRSNTLLEIIVTVCLYYIRSYYPNLPQVRLTDEEIYGNRNVRLLCMEFLTLVFSELVGIVKDSGKSFASYLNDLLQRCKVQKTLLHCLVACVYDSRKREPNVQSRNVTFTEAVVEFNERTVKLDRNIAEKNSDFEDTLQVHLLRLLATLIVLEDTVIVQTTDKDSHPGLAPKISEHMERTSQIRFQSCITTSKYQLGVPIPSQTMFLSAVLTALCYTHQAHLHIHWLSLVTSALPFAGRSLTRIVLTVVSQLCCNLESMASSSSRSLGGDKAVPWNQNAQDIVHAPPDYLITLTEGLTTLCHYCLLDCPAPVSTPLNQPPLPPVPSQPYAPGTSASQIISNLIHVFSTSSSQKDGASAREPGNSLDPILSARRTLLSNMPRIIASLSSVFEVITRIDKEDHPKSWWIMGTPKIVKQHILSFLSPISLNYGSNFMAAFAIVWHESKAKTSPPTRKVFEPWSPEQLLLVQLLAAIKVFPLESIVQTVRNVLKQPPPMSQKNQVPLEVSVLQLFLAYIQQTSGTQLNESWQSLLGLWRDGLQLMSPPVQFHLLAILHEFVQRAQLLEDKKSQKDLQEIAHKLIEACSTVACASLEQTTWLWRNLAVRPVPKSDVADIPSENADASEHTDEYSEVQLNNPYTTVNSAQYSVQALYVLAEFLAPVLDYVYVGEEKEKVVPLLSNIMYYVTPYLKNHSNHNMPSFRACCQILSSISGYQHTRKAWRKDAFELFLDTSFFQMETACLTSWKAIIDHLMTHDKTSFRDFLARVSVAQSGSLSLFSSKEQEYEQRSHLLKRLAFVLFCSEVDQYQQFMPDIQERLIESLRFPHVPSIQAQVFLCFRVLLVRMSPHHITSLWPVIITEMVQVFTQVEQELCSDSEEFSCGGFSLRKMPSSHLRRMSTLDSSWVVNSSNGLNAHNHPAWLHLYLSVCKLLDMSVALPANVLPQFQMYRWAFVGDSPPLSSENNNNRNDHDVPQTEFMPHILRIAHLVNKKVPCDERLKFVPGQLLLTMPTIKTLVQLQPFFNTLSNITYSQEFYPPVTNDSSSTKIEYKSSPLSKSRSAPELHTLFHISSVSYSQQSKSAVEQIENVLETDFLEPLPCQ